MAPPPNRFMRNWFAVEAIPLYALITAALCGGSWFAYRTARSPAVVWSKSNPEPWNTIKPDEGVKLINVNPKVEKSWSRN